MGSRSYNRPSNVIALLFIPLALMDAINGLINLQIPEATKSVAAGAKLMCPTFGWNNFAQCGVGTREWYLDIIMALVVAVLATLLLLRPERLVYAATAAWSLFMFLASVVARDNTKLDYLITVRAGIYLVAFAIAAVLLAFEWKAYMDASAAARAADLERAGAEKAAAAKAPAAAKTPAKRPVAPARRRLP